MKTLSNEFQSHLSGAATTLCNCWQIHRKDGAVLGFTDHDRDIVFDGINHSAHSGLEPSQAESFSKFSPGSLELAGALTSDVITSQDIAARKYDDARIVHYSVNWQAPEERLRIHTWIMGDIARIDGAFKAEVRSIAALMERTGLRRFERHCTASLGDKKCGVQLDQNLAEQGVITKIVDGLLIEVAGMSDHNEAWFNNGTLKFKGEDNSDLTVEIVADRRLDKTRRAIELWLPLDPSVQAGQTIKLLPGCNKRFATCREKFSNGLNFQGFPHMPTPEFISSYASVSKSMDGGPIFVDD